MGTRPCCRLVALIVGIALVLPLAPARAADDHGVDLDLAVEFIGLRISVCGCLRPGDLCSLGFEFGLESADEPLVQIHIVRKITAGKHNLRFDLCGAF